MNIRLGDKVKFVDEVGGGVVVALTDHLVTVEDEHGFQYDFALNDVVLDQKVDYSQNQISMDKEAITTNFIKGQNEVNSYISKHHRDGKVPFLEVDLHIHQLVSDSNRMSNHEIIIAQMNQVKRMWKLANELRYSKLVFIHGVGEGRLRYEIHQFLNHKSNCEYFDANIQAYGYGATEIRLWYN